MFNLTLCFNFDFSSARPILGHASPTRQFLNGTHKLSGTGSGQNGPARGSELLSSLAAIAKTRGNFESYGGKVYTRALDLSI